MNGRLREILARVKPLAIGAACGMAFLLALPLTGVLDSSAVPGSNAVVDWYRQTSARQSIALRSALTAVPDLADPAMVARGAGHYELVCANCHGSPEAAPARFAEDLSPEPPRLTAWRPDARLFHTVKYGIRHTAMPGWPTALRDDEIWAMVAFLRLLPAMDAPTYADLAHGGAEPGSCASCHGSDGQGRDGAFPRLDIQSPQYLADALNAFRDGARQSGTMMAAARQLTDGEITDLAAYFGRGVELPLGGSELGERIATLGLPERDVPACLSCHGDEGRPGYPKLGGQPVEYLVTQLELFQKHGAERGGRFAKVMAEVVEDKLEEGPHRLDPEELRAVAEYFGE
ncbi:c-type cytochrome [Devosia rhizoryzae]|uniref:C-type cytochrome n=1 Tax=Devosia rhizoryzae TaxID=2774137 RepID=A0ABX7C610_9HYPH|nr:c-type cytochrome [Devosia rhizoryzae]QQR38699.1 c-type cytochrome [Devosia rhizoryzae]